MVIPKIVLKKISAIMSKFFFHGSDENKIHMIAWHKVTMPKKKGGVSLISVPHLNAICKVKLLWKCLNRASLFGHWCVEKYHSIWGSSVRKASSLWKNFKIMALNMKGKLNYKVGNSSLFSLYFDPWCHCKSLFDWVRNHYFKCIGLPEDTHMDAIIKNGKWALPDCCLNYLQSKTLILDITITQD